MRTIGMYMAIAGLASIILQFLDRNLVILMWIDNWGETMGWVIRGGLLVVGAILFFISPATPEHIPESQTESQPMPKPDDEV